MSELASRGSSALAWSRTVAQPNDPITRQPDHHANSIVGRHEPWSPETAVGNGDWPDGHWDKEMILFGRNGGGTLTETLEFVKTTSTSAPGPFPGRSELLI